MMQISKKNLKTEKDQEIDLPKFYYNIVPDLPTPLAPMLNSQTQEPMKQKDLEILFPKQFLDVEFSKERYISIPEVLRSLYEDFGRVTPLKRLYKLEQELDTPAKIFIKREDVSPTGSHKINTAIAQAYYAANEGVQKLTTETGAGQWGSALSFATNLLSNSLGVELKAEVFMVRCSYDQKPSRKILMKLFNADVYSSPSEITNCGKQTLGTNPSHSGTLGLAISEAVERAVTDPTAKYSLGSVMNAVLIHQSVIGLETEQQLKQLDLAPDYVIGCVGGGSNFGGLAFPLRKAFPDAKLIAAESEACPALTKGKFEYDYADTAKMGPLIKGHTMGSDYIPPAIHAGGLRYHSTAPMLSNLLAAGEISPIAYSQEKTFQIGKLITQVEGLIPAPETNHALCAGVEIARKCKENNEEATIVISYSGHGLLDLSGYEQNACN